MDPTLARLDGNIGKYGIDLVVLWSQELIALRFSQQVLRIDPEMYLIL